MPEFEFVMGELPEELQMLIQQQQDMRTITQMDIDDFFDRLSYPDLVTLRTVFHMAASSTQAVGFFDGFIYTRLRAGGRCQHCGEERHEMAALEDLANSNAPKEDDVPEVPGQISIDEAIEDLKGFGDNVAEFISPTAPIQSAPFVNEFGDLTETDLENMAKYNLDDLRDTDSARLIGFVCTLCGIGYPTIADRMLREPDTCHGCFLKAGHG
jgi:hypothetical protein